MALAHHAQRRIVLLHRPDQADTALDLAVVEHHRRRGHLHGGAVRTGIDHQTRARIGKLVECGGQRQRSIPFATGDGQQPGFRSGARMGVDDLVAGDDEALSLERFQPDIIDTGTDGAFDLGGEELLERREQDALKLDGQRQQPVEEGGDRRQLILDAIVVHQLEAGGGFEAGKRAAFHLAAHEQQVELAERIAGIGAFEIILRPEQALSSGLALPARDGAERVEPARDGREKALFGLHVGGDRPEQRRLRLIGAIGASESLDRGVGLPARFQQIMDAQPLVLRGEISMIAATGAAGVGEDEDALVVVHEGGGLGEIGRAGARCDESGL